MPAQRRRAFTLVEMLAVVSIIGILASMLLGALFVATQRAREDRTRALVKKLHNQMMQRWEEYETRRVPINATAWRDPLETFGQPTGPPPPPSPQTRFFLDDQRLRDNADYYKRVNWKLVLAKRELMRMELPDCYQDLLFTPQVLGREFDADGDPSNGKLRDFVAIDTTLRRAYQQRVRLAVVELGFDPDVQADFDQAIVDLSAAKESAEMLYLIMTTASGDEDSGGVHFSEKDVADTDNDGMPEFIDAWGNSIEWIRWPAGFVNETSIGAVIADPSAVGSGYVTDLMADTVDNDPDPFDPLQLQKDTTVQLGVANSLPGAVNGTGQVNRDEATNLGTFVTGYRLTPLIYSAGPDGYYGLRALRQSEETPGQVLTPAGQQVVFDNYSDPYYWWPSPFPVPSGGPIEIRRRGMPAKRNIATGEFDNIDGEWVHLDNITNHLLEVE